MRYKIVAALTTCALAGSVIAVANASARAPGDTLTYSLITDSKLAGGMLPPGYKPIPASTTTITVSIKSIDAAGTAVVHVKEHVEPLASFTPAQRAALEDGQNGKECDAKMSATGAILVVVNNNPQPSSLAGMTPQQVQAKAVADVHDPVYQGNIAANNIKGMFAVANAVAIGYAKRKSFAPGDTWHFTNADGAVYNLAVSGRQSYQGHDVLAVDAKTKTDNQNGTFTSDSTVYYDPKAEVVVGVHTVAVNNIQVSGMTSTTTTDLNLKE